MRFTFADDVQIHPQPRAEARVQAARRMPMLEWSLKAVTLGALLYTAGVVAGWL